MADIDVKVQMAAYEKGILPQRLSQLENDVPYVTEDWVRENFQLKGDNGLKIDCGNILNRK